MRNLFNSGRGLIASLIGALTGALPLGALQSATGQLRGRQKARVVISAPRTRTPEEARERDARRALVKRVGRRQALIEIKTMRAAKRGDVNHAQLARRLARITEAHHG
jgi:hypothetical protein